MNLDLEGILELDDTREGWEENYALPLEALVSSYTYIFLFLYIRMRVHASFYLEF